MKRITIKDIAKMAGVSRGTVDRVINNRGSVSPVIKETVLKIAAEYGYEKNIIASRLASPKEFKIAVVFPSPENDIFWELPQKGIQSALNLVKYYGVRVDYFEYNLFEKKEYISKISNAIESKPDAIILAPLYLKESLKYLSIGEEEKIPFITINTEINHPNILSYIGQSSFHSGYLAGKLFDINLNDNDEIIVLNLAHEISNAQHYTDKVNGLLDYFKIESSKVIKINWFEFDDFLDSEKLLNRFRKIQERHPNMKGIFFTNSRAYKLLSLLGEYELNDITVIGFDILKPNIEFLNKNKIDFIINQNPFIQGYNGIMNFVDHFIHQKNIKQKQYLPLDIVVKENVIFYNNNT